MSKNKEQEVTKEVSETTETTTVNNSALSMDEIITRIENLSENENPYSVSKEIEELKSLFYSKLKTEQKEEITEIEVKETETEEGTTEEEVKKSLHPLEVKFKQSFGKYKKIKFEYRKQREEQEQNNLKIKLQIIKDIDKLTQEDESIKKTFEHFKILQKQWKATGYVPQIENNNLWQSYHHHVELFYDYIKLNNDLRDLDFKRNLEEKTAICEKAEALLNENSLNKMHESLQELHEHWKNIGPVQREIKEEIWERFQKISRTLNKKRNDYFIQKKDEESKKIEQKNNICSEIEILSKSEVNSHSAWQKLTSKCIDLETKWKSIGRLNKSDNKIAWKNLRTALNNFYNSKNEFYKKKKEENKSIIATKLAIAEKAEALQNSTDWKETGSKLIKLQEQWKNSGFASKQVSEKIWKRFKTACKLFFDAKKTHYKGLDNVKEQNLKAKQNLLKEIEKFKSKIAVINGNEIKLNKEKEMIRAKIDDVKKIIIQYENNISFFGKSKRNNSLKKQVEDKIESAQKEVENLKEKLKIINRH